MKYLITKYFKNWFEFFLSNYASLKQQHTHLNKTGHKIKNEAKETQQKFSTENCQCKEAAVLMVLTYKLYM